MFQGFSDTTADFLWQIRFNNSREWLHENKQAFTDFVQTPMREIANEVYEKMKSSYPQMMFNLHVSRIYRDARRLHGRGPLKDHLWFSVFGPRDVRYLGPEFFFEIEPEGYSYGMGVWSADAAAMKCYREDILSEKKEITKLAKDLMSQDKLKLCGEDYVKSKGDVSPLLKPWLQKKKVYFQCSRPYDEISFSAQLVQELTDGFSFLLPYYRYFDDLCRRDVVT